MAYKRTKTINGKKYSYLQECVREGGKVKTKHIKYLGSDTSIGKGSSSSSSGSKQNLKKEKKTIPNERAFKTVGVQGGGEWYNGKLYYPLKSFNKTKRDNITGSIQLGTSKKFLYTTDKKRRVKGFAPKELL